VASHPDHGALVISLDFELHWGVRDKKTPDGPYRENLLGVWNAVPRMLELFGEFQVGATWATVGFLLSRSRAELEALSPTIRPRYADPNLSPYGEPTGQGEGDDPLHFAPTLVDTVRATPRQELGTHTFSHYYCLEPDQDAEAFRADLGSALAVAEARGVERPRSIVFPRNQRNPAYDGVLRDLGIRCFRGNAPSWMYSAESELRKNVRVRGARMIDTYAGIAGPLTTPWARVLRPDGLCDVPASFFLRPYAPSLRALEPLLRRRLQRAMERAAKSREIVHLWWHPHNFGTHLEENLALLRSLLQCFARLRRSHGMRSYSMGEAALAVTGEAA
jgi:peptidoglycan/xylan/chitin deacetylase (PgdA/CDA1 family)